MQEEDSVMQCRVRNFCCKRKASTKPRRKDDRVRHAAVESQSRV